MVSQGFVNPAETPQEQWNREECQENGVGHFSVAQCYGFLEFQCNLVGWGTWLTNAQCADILCIEDQAFDSGSCFDPGIIIY
jgi:hypothetical protein